MKYTITIEETVVKGFKVEANSADGAYEIAEGRPEILARLCMVVDWCLEHPEYTAKLRVISKKNYPLVLPCIF